MFYYCFLTSPMPCYVIPCKLCIILSWNILFAYAYNLYDCALYLFRPLVCLVFIRIDVEQGSYQETQEFYPEPSYSPTELPGKHFPMFALHIVPIAAILFLHHVSRSELKLNPKYCIAFTFKPHWSLFPQSYETLIQALSEPCEL